MKQRNVEYFYLDSKPNYDDTKFDIYDITDEGIKKGKHNYKGLVDLE